jgi:hypothetical protein
MADSLDLPKTTAVLVEHTARHAKSKASPEGVLRRSAYPPILSINAGIPSTAQCPEAVIGEHQSITSPTRAKHDQIRLTVLMAHPM